MNLVEENLEQLNNMTASMRISNASLPVAKDILMKFSFEY